MMFRKAFLSIVACATMLPATLLASENYRVMTVVSKNGTAEYEINDVYRVDFTTKTRWEVAIADNENGVITGAGMYKDGATVTIKASAGAGFEFDGWYVGSTLVSDKAQYSFVATEDVSYEARFKEAVVVAGDPEFVNLGLSVKWATTNIGAVKPEDVGGYFAWAEPSPRTSNFTPEGYLWYDDKEEQESLKWIYQGGTEGEYYKLIEPEKDAATQTWGNGAFIPTQNQCQELFDNCTITKIEQGGKQCYKLTSNVEGFEDKFIIVPISGDYEGDVLQNDSYAYFWSSKADGTKNSMFSQLYGDNGFQVYTIKKCYGLPIRPVKF